MRRLALLFAGGAVWLFLLALPAFADNGPHQKGQFIGTTTASCAACHRAHSAQNADILRQPMPQLCYTCHGAGASGATTDVQDGVAYGDTATTHVAGAPGSAGFAGALRGGGFDYALIDTTTVQTTGSGATLKGTLQTIGTTSAGVATRSTHSVDGSAVTMWGNGAINATANAGKAAVELTCGSCHDPHGNGQYRILRTAPEDSATSTGGGKADAVAINDAGSKAYTTTNFGVGGLISHDDSALNGDGSAISYTISSKTFTGTYLEASSQWCAMCHTRYMTGTDSALTDSGDAVFAYRHAVRTLVDPANLGAPTSGVITPANTGNIGATGVAGVTLLTGVTIGSYIDSSCNTIRGVAVIPNSAYNSGLPTTCTFGAASQPVNAPTKSAVVSHVSTLSSGAPRCITCHVAHGSDAAVDSSITSQTSPGTVGVALDSTLLRLNNRGLCEACHNK